MLDDALTEKDDQMTRRCDTCEWSRPHPLSEPGETKWNGWLSCREGPKPFEVGDAHWCGRYRIAERLTGGVDVREEGR